jgi:hypothetical protein
VLQFEWDPIKAETNFEKHQVSFKEAASIFGDPLSYTFDDPDNSDEECRFLSIGRTVTGKLLMVSHTECDNKIRIISARELTRRERKFYEEGG